MKVKSESSKNLKNTEINCYLKVLVGKQAVRKTIFFVKTAFALNINTTNKSSLIN